MMHKGIIVALLGGLSVSSASYAAPGLPGHRHIHSHEDAVSHGQAIDKQHAIEMAHEVITKLANLKKIDSSWINVDTNIAEKKQYPSGLEWVVRFNNPDINNERMRNLYIFLTLEGRYIAANYTGN